MSQLARPCEGTVSQHWAANPARYARFGLPGHNGVDFANRPGTPVVAVAAGTVAFAGNDIDYGNYVRLHHAHLGLDSFYAHLAGVHFAASQAGATVAQGQAIGTMGTTGNSTGPHLHLEFRLSDAGVYLLVGGGYGKGRVDPEIVYWLLNRERL